MRAYPTLYVLDAAGRIRASHVRGKALAETVEALLAEHEAR